jgi:hypothetical protein
MAAIPPPRATPPARPHPPGGPSRNSKCLSVACFGLIDLRAQTEVRSVLRPDTPTNLNRVPPALCGGTSNSILTHLVRI